MFLDWFICIIVKTCNISTNRQDFFSRHALNNFDDFYTLSGDLVSRPGKRPVYKVVLKEAEKELGFFLKKIENVTFSDVRSQLKKGLGFHTDAYLEQAQVQRYKSLNLPIMKVAAWGESFKLGWPRAGFILLEQVPGVGLDTYVIEATIEKRDQALMAFGALTAKLHGQGILDVTRLQDVICQHDSACQVNLVIIDREHGTLKKQPISYESSANYLARLYMKTLIQLNKTEPALELTQPFLEGYLANSPFEKAMLLREIKAQLKSLILVSQKYKRFTWLLAADFLK